MVIISPYRCDTVFNKGKNSPNVCIIQSMSNDDLARAKTNASQTWISNPKPCKVYDKIISPLGYSQIWRCVTTEVWKYISDFIMDFSIRREKDAQKSDGKSGMVMPWMRRCKSVHFMRHSVAMKDTQRLSETETHSLTCTFYRAR